MSFTNFVDTDEDWCFHCGHNEFNLSWDNTMYVCNKCGKPVELAKEVKEKRKKNKVRKFKDSESM